MNRPTLHILTLALLSLACLPVSALPLFTDDERSTLLTFWNAPGRYSVALPPDAAQKGAWQVRLTPEGSAWLLKYQIAVGAARIAPTVDPTSVASDRAGWKSWVQAKIAWDRKQAQAAADAANAALGQPAPAAPNGSVTTALKTSASAAPAVAPPGPIPPSLLEAVGNPPPFAAAVTPLQHTVTFDDGDLYRYTDNTALPAGFAYYRFPQGVAVYGKPAPASELNPIFQAAGMTPSEQRIACAVSKLEGSFESINTYDTGYVSVGFLQFITLDDGKHSLCEVMFKEKQDHPNEFAQDFHRYGIEVTADGVIDVVDPATGAELVGPEAVRKLVDDKRLIAIFQKAGRHSKAFRIAQVQIAKSHYWPTDDPITVTIGGQTLTGKVSDVVTSEAGIATLFDRKVNRGSCAPINEVLSKVMTAHNLTTLADAAAYEEEIITALKYRGDFLHDRTLSQPRRSLHDDKQGSDAVSSAANKN